MRTPIRAHSTRRARQEDPIAPRTPRFGWHALVPNAGPQRRSVPEAVWGARHADRLERLGNRLKSRGPIAPLGGKRNDPLAGRTDLLTLGVRVVTGMECVRRRSLQQAPTTRPGVHPDHKTKRTDKPTAERILQACADVSRTIRPHAAGEAILRRLTPLSGGQEAIRPWLGLGTALSRQLAMHDIGN